MLDALVDNLPDYRPPISAQPYRGWKGDLRLLSLPGVEHVRWGGARRREPVGTLFGMSAPRVSEGLVTFTMPCSDWLAGYLGDVQPGVLAVLADAAHAAGVMTTLPAGQVLQTLTLDLSFVAAPSLTGGELRCEARAQADGSDMPMLSSAVIEDAEGRRIAETTARSVRHEVPGEHGKPPVPTFDDEKGPFEQPVIGHIPSSRLLANTAPLTTLRQLASCELGLPPIYHLTGLRLASAERGEAIFAIPASEWLASFSGNVYGGVLALLLEVAASGAVSTMLQTGQGQLPVELKISFVRSMSATGDPILGRGRVIRCGRNVAFASSEALMLDGRTVAVATSTHVIGI